MGQTNSKKFATVYSRAIWGVTAHLITVEAHLTRGLPKFNLIGMNATAAKESRYRIRSAIINAGFDFPLGQITASLAPADLPKLGTHFDLPIALSILIASKQLPKETLTQYEFVGELSLSGQLRKVNNLLTFAVATKREGTKHLILPTSNVEEASLIRGLTLYPAETLLEISLHLKEITPIVPINKTPGEKIQSAICQHDLQDVIGQNAAKQAMIIAAAGEHNLLFSGPPGTGKTMLAQRLPSLLPPLTEEESLEVATVYSQSHIGFSANQWGMRPFRTPHHTASSIALIGGGNPPKPGEVSLAHHGILFLDEFPEFDRRVLEVLREPLEASKVSISRACHQTVFPARLQLIAAMNLCPCGYLGDSEVKCRCTKQQIQRYQHRLSGPLLDRIDLHLNIVKLPQQDLFTSSHQQQPSESSKNIRVRVVDARKRQLKRAGKINAHLTSNEIKQFCPLKKTDCELLETAMKQLHLSTRAMFRSLKVARTIADLNKSQQISRQHLQEALSYRTFSRFTATASH